MMNGLFLKQQLVTGGLKCAKQASKEDVVVFGKTSIDQNVGIFEPYQRR